MTKQILTPLKIYRRNDPAGDPLELTIKDRQDTRIAGVTLRSNPDLSVKYANLFCAAPELLEACEKAREAFSNLIVNLGPDFDLVGLNAIEDVMIAAIAKAQEPA